ncbi:unnamed protein product, partial [Rotaria magnacalcarata]
EYKSKSAELSFTFGANPNNYNVVRKNIQTNFNENNLITFSPIHNQQENCMWDLSRCSTELTFTFIFSIDRMNSSSSIFSQYFKNDASLHINFIVLNSSSPSLHFDLWLPFNH